MSGPKAEYFPGKRFETPAPGRELQNPYDMTGPVIDDLRARGLEPFVVFDSVDLSTAGEKSFNTVGRHLVFYGHDGTATKAVNTTAYAQLQFEVDSFNDAKSAFPMKHARGWSGPFTKFVLKWPAQNNVFIDVIVLRYNEKPWVDGESCT